ncbi:MAG: hypothetical protein ACOC2N_01090 [Spirochaetota bacterium]
MNLAVSPQRVGLLMRHDLATQRKSLTTAFITLAGVTFGLFMFAAATAGGAGFHESVFANILFIGGYVVSSTAFAELHDPKSGVHYLMLPGSSLEKYLARLLLTSIGWTLAVLVGYIVMTGLSAAVAGIFFDTHPGVFLPARRAIWGGIGTYLVTQSIFLFGSIYFRKVAFLRTALSTIVVAISLGLIYLVAIRVFFAPAFIGAFETVGGVEQMITGPNGVGITEFALESVVPVFETLQRILLWVVTPVFFWIAGVLRLRETEV